MAKLRRETLAAHTSIEQSAAMRAVFEDGFTLGDYRALLRRLLQFYRPFEESVFGSLPPATAAELAHRRKAAWLTNDLHALQAGDAPALRAPVPVFRSDAARLGGLYVLEGATLGGKLIRKRLIAHFGGAVAGALTFYTGYGSRSGAEWQSFRAFLSRLFDEADAATRSEVIAGAIETFGALERWLAGLKGHPRAAAPLP